MPLRLNIAMSRKIGEPNYGSRGATVGLEMEVDTSLVDQPPELQQRIANLFRLAKVAVDRELDTAALGNGSSDNHNGTVIGGTRRRAATAAQLRAIRAIAEERNIDLPAELQHRFQVDRLDELSVDQASRLIDAIKLVSNDPEHQI